MMSGLEAGELPCEIHVGVNQSPKGIHTQESVESKGVVSLDEFDLTIETPRSAGIQNDIFLDLANLTDKENAGNPTTEISDAFENNILTEEETVPDIVKFLPSEDVSANDPEIPKDQFKTDVDLSESDKLNNEQIEEGRFLQQSKEFSDIAPGNVKPENTEFTSLAEEAGNSASNNNGEAELEDEDPVALDSILMQDHQESDSGSEFDFDLPPTKIQPQPQSQTVGQGVTQAQSSPQPVSSPAIQQVEPPIGTAGITQKAVAVIKPTSQLVEEEQQLSEPVIAAPDVRTQRGLEFAQQEWDNVTTIQAGYKEASTLRGVEPTVVQTVQPMSPYELLQVMRQEDFSSVRSSIRPSIERRGFAAFINLLFGPPKLNRPLLEERDRVFCVAATQLSNENTCHMRTLQTVYRSLTGSKFDCARIGSHWEEIGFQGTDPATDLRGAGMLGLMNLLCFLKDPKRQALASDIYRLSLHPTQNFPFCVMGINLSRIVLQTLRENLLNKECNRRNDVFGVVNDFYAGLYLQLYQVWKQGKTVSDSGYILKDLEFRAKKFTREVFKNLEEYYDKKKSVIMTEKVVNPGGDNFVNVCDDQ